MNITCERLAYWFLRLNGFLTIENFVVHADEGTGQRTDVDVLGVRFLHRLENQIRPMADHPTFAHHGRKQVILVETKRSLCRLNSAWTNPAVGNLRRVLAAGGFFDVQTTEAVAQVLHAEGVWEDQSNLVRLIAIGADHNRSLARGRFHRVPQLLWYTDVLPFVHERFWSYRNEKRMHPQWDQDGRNLFEAVQCSDGNPAVFAQSVSIDGV